MGGALAGAAGRERVPGASVRTCLEVGGKLHQLDREALVMGILNRTPDSFYDHGETFELDACLARAETLVAQGADILDVGGVKAGPGPEVTPDEEMDRVIPTIEALTRRFPTPVSVDTWRAPVAEEAYRHGAAMGNDISGFADPGYLPAAARAGATVVATHIRLAPRVRDPDPEYHDVVAAVRGFLVERAGRARSAGIAPERIVLDAGLDLGKTPEQSLILLRASDTLAGLGYPLLLSSSNKTFLGALFDLDITDRREVSHAATALGMTLGCRIFRVHDVAGTRRVCDTLSAVLGAGMAERGPTVHPGADPGAVEQGPSARPADPGAAARAGLPRRGTP